MKERKPHKLKYNPYLEKLYFSNKPIIIYKVLDGNFEMDEEEEDKIEEGLLEAQAHQTLILEGLGR